MSKLKMTPAPDEKKIEQLLGNIQPQPSARFYERIAGQPWRGEKPDSFWSWLPSRRLPVTLTLVLVLILFFSLATPSLETVANRIAEFFTPSESRSVSIEIPVQDVLDPESRFSLSISEAGALADFDLTTPAWLPEGYQFTGAQHNPVRHSITLNYTADSNYILRITQRPVGIEYQRINVQAPVEIVEIRGSQAEYVTGGWRIAEIQPTPGGDASDTAPMEATWDPAANIHFLRWQDDDILYEIIFSGGEPDSRQSLQKDDLIAIAESLH